MINDNPDNIDAIFLEALIEEDGEKAIELFSKYYEIDKEEKYDELLIKKIADYNYSKGLYIKAANWYKKSADQNYVDAQYNLANLYLRGDGVTQNDYLAFSWFIKAAEQGDAPAQYNLGRMYLLGKGSDKNIIEGRFWMQLAIENDDEYIRLLAQEVWDEFKLGSY